MEIVRTIIAAVMVSVASDVLAFQVEQSNSDFVITNGVAVLKVGDAIYTVADIPSEAPQIESTETLEQHQDFKISTGIEIAKDEALGVIEQYYKHTAFDFSSIVIRDFKVGKRQYVFWCSNPWLFGCLNRQGRAGTWVEFSVNGANRNGGMSGFSRTIFLIRKTDQSQPP